MNYSKNPLAAGCNASGSAGSLQSSSGEQRVIPRREFFINTLGTAGIFPLCCTSPIVPPESFSYHAENLILDPSSLSGLQKVGSAMAIVDDRRKLNIIIVHMGKKRFAALDRTCTHGGAMCAYNHRRQTLQCTSLNHAEYNLSGRLLHGRTHGNLHSYKVRLIGKQLEIALRESE